VRTSTVVGGPSQQGSSNQSDGGAIAISGDVMDDLPPWAEALLFITKNNTVATVQGQFPADSLTPGIVQDIVNTSISTVRSSSAQEFKFMFRARDKKIDDGGMELRNDRGEIMEGRTAITSATLFYYCYTSFKQRIHVGTDGNSYLLRQALVFVSRWPFPQLAYRLLSQLDEAFSWQLNPTAQDSRDSTTSSSGGGGGGSNGGSVMSKRTSIQSERLDAATLTSAVLSSEGSVLEPSKIRTMLATAMDQVLLWPAPSPDTTLSIPFLGKCLDVAFFPVLSFFK